MDAEEPDNEPFFCDLHESSGLVALFNTLVKIAACKFTAIYVSVTIGTLYKFQANSLLYGATFQCYCYKLREH